MIGFLWRIIVGSFTACRHKWSTIEQGQLVTPGTDIVRGGVHIMRCEHCGEVTFRSWRT